MESTYLQLTGKIVIRHFSHSNNASPSTNINFYRCVNQNVYVNALSICSTLNTILQLYVYLAHVQWTLQKQTLWYIGLCPLFECCYCITLIFMHDRDFSWCMLQCLLLGRDPLLGVSGNRESTMLQKTSQPLQVQGTSPGAILISFSFTPYFQKQSTVGNSINLLHVQLRRKFVHIIIVNFI